MASLRSPLSSSSRRHCPSVTAAAACAVAAIMGVLLSIQGGMNVAVAALLYHPADDDTVCGTDASSQLLAALVNFSCGVLTLFVLVAAHELWQWRRGAHLCAELQRPSRWFEVCGGPLGVAILCLTVVGYNLAGFAIVAVVRAAGTAAAALTFDHFGCLGQRRRMTARRCLGAPRHGPSRVCSCPRLHPLPATATATPHAHAGTEAASRPRPPAPRRRGAAAARLRP